MEWTECELFQGLSQEVRRSVQNDLRAHIRHVRVKAGTTIHQPDSVLQHLVLVECGLLRSVHYTNQGEELSSFYYPPGASVFHIACLTRNPVHSCCMSVQNSQFAAIPCADFIAALDTLQMAAYAGRFCGAKRPRCGANGHPL